MPRRSHMVQEKEKDLIQMLQAYLTTALFAVVRYDI